MEFGIHARFKTWWGNPWEFDPPPEHLKEFMSSTGMIGPIGVTGCGGRINRDLNAAIDLRNFGLNKIGVVSPKSTPVDREALAYSSSIGISETTLEEAGISVYSMEYTENNRKSYVTY